MLGHKRGRFSLYLLEEGERYVCDALAVYYMPKLSRGSPQSPPPPVEVGTSISVLNHEEVPGCLRFATRALYFEPEDDEYPVLKFPLKNIAGSNLAPVGLADVPEAPLSASFNLSSPLREAEAIAFCCTVVMGMMERGIPSPYMAHTAAEPHAFRLLWERIDVAISRLNNLLFAAQAGEAYPTERKKFDLSRLGSVAERILQQEEVTRLFPLLTVQGGVLLTNAAIYFQSYENYDSSPVEVFPLGSIRLCDRQRYELRNTAVEIQVTDSRVLFVAFASEHAAEVFYSRLVGQPMVRMVSAKCKEIMMDRWVHGDIPTLDYLLYLNWIAGRSVNDLSAYPVLPWVVADYTSFVLNLDDPAVFRDLSRPIGALSSDRLKYFQQRMADSGEPYLYGTHFSCPAYVVYFLVREHPEWMLKMHGGTFDKGPRIFDSIPQCWASVLSQTHDLKELIPQFYYGSGEFLTARPGLRLGMKEGGVKVRDAVELPGWALTPADFIAKHRMALESEYVSKNIHLWIDLIFGCKSRGSEALEANNLYHPMTYDAYDRISEEPDEVIVHALLAQVREFGQCPKKIFDRPHPPRKTFPSNSHCLTAHFPPPSLDLIVEEQSAVPNTAQMVDDLIPSHAPRTPSSMDPPRICDLSTLLKGDTNIPPPESTPTKRRRHLLVVALGETRKVQTDHRHAPPPWTAPAPLGSFQVSAAPDGPFFPSNDSCLLHCDCPVSDVFSNVRSSLSESQAWKDVLRNHILDAAEEMGDDMVWFVRDKCNGYGAYLKRKTDADLWPVDDDEIFWKESVYLNIVVHWRYEIVLAVVHDPPNRDGTLQAADWVRLKAYASPTTRPTEYTVSYPEIFFSADEGAMATRLPSGAFMWAVELCAVYGEGSTLGIPLMRATVAHMDLANHFRNDRKGRIVLKDAGRAVELDISLEDTSAKGLFRKKGVSPKESPFMVHVSWIALHQSVVAHALHGGSPSTWLRLPHATQRCSSTPPLALPPPPDEEDHPEEEEIKLDPDDFVSFWCSLSPEAQARIDAGGSIDSEIRQWVQKNPRALHPVSSSSMMSKLKESFGRRSNTSFSTPRDVAPSTPQHMDPTAPDSPEGLPAALPLTDLLGQPQALTDLLGQRSPEGILAGSPREDSEADQPRRPTSSSAEDLPQAIPLESLLGDEPPCLVGSAADDSPRAVPLESLLGESTPNGGQCPVSDGDEELPQAVPLADLLGEHPSDRSGSPGAVHGELSPSSASDRDRPTTQPPDGQQDTATPEPPQTAPDEVPQQQGTPDLPALPESILRRPSSLAIPEGEPGSDSNNGFVDGEEPETDDESSAQLLLNCRQRSFAVQPTSTTECLPAFPQEGEVVTARRHDSVSPQAKAMMASLKYETLFGDQETILAEPFDTTARAMWKGCFENPPKLFDVAPSCDYQGWASKKGGSIGWGWSQRLLVVRGSFLYYFATLDAASPARGCVYLQGAKLHYRRRTFSPHWVIEIRSTVPRHPAGFKGENQERVFHFAFSTELERDALCLAIAPGVLELRLRQIFPTV